MPGLLFHQGAVMNCPDQGVASIVVPTQVRVMVSGMPVAVVTDQIAVAGCKFLANPHLKVEWLQPSVRVMVEGRPVMLQPIPVGPGAGTCMPGPAPPDIKQMQSRVMGM